MSKARLSALSKPAGRRKLSVKLFISYSHENRVWMERLGVFLKTIQKHTKAFHPDAIFVRVADEQLHREFATARGFGQGREASLAHDSTSSLIRRSSVSSGV